MANARKTTMRVTQEVDAIQLDLTMDEANALRSVLHKIAGHPDRTRRGLTANIAEALTAIGADYDVSDIAPTYPGSDYAGIRFLEDSERD